MTKEQWNANQVAEIAKVDVGGSPNYDRVEIIAHVAPGTRYIHFTYFEDDQPTAQSQNVDPVEFISHLIPQLPTVAGVNVCRS